MKRKTLKEKARLPRLKHWLFDWTETIVVALVLALIIRAFFLQVFWIPSGSMEPTLDINDRIVVNKVTYFFRPPRRLEVVVFRQVAAFDSTKKDLIKRLVGLPGETLELKNGIIYINNQPVAERHPIHQDYANFGPLVIPPDSFFVMGDNRPESADSRYWGFLPKTNLIGPAFLRIWPLLRFGLIPAE
jgi:signal peptidase I